MKFRISRAYKGLSIEVLFENLEETGLALQNLRQLARHTDIEEAQTKAERFWFEDGTRRISDQITDSGERIALSLLAHWPESVRNADIVNETDLSRAGVYDNLTGRRGDKGDWFASDGELYRLTRKGEDSIVDMVLHLVDTED